MWNSRLQPSFGNDSSHKFSPINLAVLPIRDRSHSHLQPFHHARASEFLQQVEFTSLNWTICLHNLGFPISSPIRAEYPLWNRMGKTIGTKNRSQNLMGI